MPDPEKTVTLNPEPSPEATLRLPVGAPGDPQSTLRLELPKHLNAHVTQRLPVVSAEGDPNQTQKIVNHTGEAPPIRLQKLDQPAEAEGQTQKMEQHPKAPSTFGWKLPVGLGLLVVLGAIAYVLTSRHPTAQPSNLPVAGSTPAVTDTVPPAAKVYLEQAQAGDAHAMRMLGAMYYYGLNVPQDRYKGRYWYGKAAEKGSDAARSELNKIEGGR
jgi:hypothetical protein